jgi:hypothetical protein
MLIYSLKSLDGAEEVDGGLLVELGAVLAV